jgi:multidrug efflux pump subunit AcrB
MLLIAMGRKAGFIIGFVLFLTIKGTFLVMFVDGSLLMERISLGALIIALCMLIDNAIVVTEGFKVLIESGESKLEVIRDVISQSQWPLFGATGIAVIAFAAIGLSEKTGEYCNSLFWVILSSLALSWMATITVTPLLAYRFLHPRPAETPEHTRTYSSPRRCMASARWIRASSRPRRGRNSWWIPFCRPPRNTGIRSIRRRRRSIHPVSARRHSRVVIHRRRSSLTSTRN